ncbi:ATP phosphoribosyltransferase [Tepidibacillus marianensis]|uniref:ATP phosphoribosyltransferase n=1 Tax=Tepidibacillus marianensis TaxID=3131995 RepID=UPI0030D520F3
MKENRLTIAVPKGRIMEEAIEIWRKAGLSVPEDIEDTRKLILTTEDGEVEWILSKPMDVPTYVEYGVADIGIAGKDVLMETGREVYELLDLKISQCRLSVAGLPNTEPKGIMPRIASKYPRVAEKYFREQGKQVEVIELHGSVELGPIVGLSDRIVDIVSTGRTLKENGLVEYETIEEISTRLIANQVSYRMKQREIKELMERLIAVI